METHVVEEPDKAGYKQPEAIVLEYKPVGCFGVLHRLATELLGLF